MPSSPLIAATSDIHSPRFLHLLRMAVSAWSLGRPCVLLLAGDLLDRGRVGAFKPALDLLELVAQGAPIVGVFGNEDYDTIREAIAKTYPRVLWLQDDYTVVDCGCESLGIVGSTGALDSLTRWQARNRPELERVFRERPRLLEELISRARREAGRVVLLTHYAVSRATVEGEDPRIYPYLYSSMMERMIARARPSAAVHGHAHNGKPRASVAGVPVYNVALPLNKRIVRVQPRSGLEAFL